MSELKKEHLFILVHNNEGRKFATRLRNLLGIGPNSDRWSYFSKKQCEEVFRSGEARVVALLNKEERDRLDEIVREHLENESTTNCEFYS